MASFFAKAKILASKAKDRVVDSTKKGYTGGQKQGTRAADEIETRSAASATNDKGDNTSPSSREGGQQRGIERGGSSSEELPMHEESKGDGAGGAGGGDAKPMWKKAVKTTGGVFGAIAGATVGVGRALYVVLLIFLHCVLLSLVRF